MAKSTETTTVRERGFPRSGNATVDQATATFFDQIEAGRAVYQDAYVNNPPGPPAGEAARLAILKAADIAWANTQASAAATLAAVKKSQGLN